MENFYTTRIIGGTYDNKGCEFDNFETLINSYFSLLFDTLTKDGITYSTGRNGTLAKVELDTNKGGFINYVQPSIGQWDYNNPKYQRIVSPEFVLYLFNNLCLLETYEKVNFRSKTWNEKMKFNSQNQSINGVFFKDLSMSSIIELHKYHQEEKLKKHNGLPNKFDQIKTNEIYTVDTLYNLIGAVVEYAKDFYDFNIKLKRAEQLRTEEKAGKIDFETLSEQDQELLTDFYEDEEYYMSLGFFNNSIRRQVAKKLVKLQLQKKKASRLGIDLNKISTYDDPICLTQEECEEENEYYGYGENIAIISYKDAKEFPSSKITLIDKNYNLSRK